MDLTNLFRRDPDSPAGKPHLLRDGLIAFIFLLFSALGAVFPLFFAIPLLLSAYLFRGQRTGFAVLLTLLSALLQGLLFGSVSFALLQPVFTLLALVPALLLKKVMEKRPHFDGVLLSCLSVGVALGAVYGILFVMVGAEPIHAICEACDRSFAAAGDSAAETLRLMWESKQAMLLSETGAGFQLENALSLMEQAEALTTEQLLAQTAGFIEVMARNTLPVLAVFLVTVGGLLLYVLPRRAVEQTEHGIGKWLGLTVSGERPVPKLQDWALPRDIAAGLFIAVALLLIVSLSGMTALDNAMVIVYRVFTCVFYVQGLAFAAFLARSWKKGGRNAFLTGVALTLFSVLPMVGIMEHFLHLRLIITARGRLKEMLHKAGIEVYTEVSGEEPKEEDRSDDTHGNPEE